MSALGGSEVLTAKRTDHVGLRMQMPPDMYLNLLDMLQMHEWPPNGRTVIDGQGTCVGATY
jgi:hypothetical protein